MTVVAEEQTSGKGRLARGWFSPYGRGVWVSVVLKPPFLPEEAPKCTLMAAVAVVKAINKYKGVHASIKWPNDILLEGRKMVGILTEMSAEFGKINYIVIGTGINTNVPRSMVPDELKELAISVADVAKEPIHRVQILADYLKTWKSCMRRRAARDSGRSSRNGASTRTPSGRLSRSWRWTKPTTGRPWISMTTAC